MLSGIFEGHRHWKWMLPGVVSIVLLVAGLESMSRGHAWYSWAIIFGVAGICLVAAIENLWARWADDWANNWVNVRSEMNATPEVRMFEAAKGMHPDAVRALLIHRRTVWRVKYIPLKDVVDWVLDEAPTVHAGFVDFVLDHSNGTIMSKRLLSEGSKSFDPDGLVTDYQQYDDLIRLMQRKLMITAAYGNQGPKIIPPYTLDLIRHRFGLDGAAYDVEEDMSDAMRRVMAEQKKAASVAPSAAGSDPKAGQPEFIQKTLEDLKPLSS